jgi:ribonucleoside-triphosphate reductase
MALSNNSVAYTDKPDAETFMREWTSLIESKSGERGIFNRVAAKKQAEKNGRRDSNYEFGCNPCSEIILRPYQFCNLTEVVIRSSDTLYDLKRKVRLATILGTAQSTMTKFPYLRRIWNENTEEERLLGVSLTGIMDNPLTNGKEGNLKELLCQLKKHAVTINSSYATNYGIPQSTAITCVKPSGTVSQLVNSASGIHARHSKYYVRTVRGDAKDPLTNFMIDQGVPNEPDITKPKDTVVFSFPMKSPEGCVTRNDMTAVEQLQMWLIYQEHWCEHKPSCTVTVRDHEWVEVGAFVYTNFDAMSGVSFLPHSDHIYQQAPYQDCTKQEYDAMLKLSNKSIDWEKLSDYEKEDTTSGSQTFACSGDTCEIVDIGA